MTETCRGLALQDGLYGKCESTQMREAGIYEAGSTLPAPWFFVEGQVSYGSRMDCEG